jgi:hypothetical protein
MMREPPIRGELVRLPSGRIVHIDRVSIEGDTIGASYWQPRIGPSPHERDRLNLTWSFVQRWAEPVEYPR